MSCAPGSRTTPGKRWCGTSVCAETVLPFGSLDSVMVGRKTPRAPHAIAVGAAGIAGSQAHLAASNACEITANATGATPAVVSILHCYAHVMMRRQNKAHLRTDKVIDEPSSTSCGRRHSMTPPLSQDPDSYAAKLLSKEPVLKVNFSRASGAMSKAKIDKVRQL